MIKKPTWKWYIPLYFFLGGIAGGAAVIGAAADFLGGPKHRSTVRHSRYLTMALAPVCAVLLITDLGRPMRFHHMLRVFKGSSPLSVGTWVLSGFGLVSGVLAARQAAEDSFILRRDSLPGRLARLLPSGPFTASQGLLGLALGGYTGTLLAATAVPLWAAGGVLMGPLFLSTALASGAAALKLIGTLTRTHTSEASEQIEAVETVATISQLGLVAAREVLVPQRVSAPLRTGLWGRIFQFGAVGAGMVTPMALGMLTRLASPRTRRTVSTISTCLTLAGALAERFAITEAGKVSAEDPLAYQTMTRGAPGEARPTAAQQERRAPAKARQQPFQPHQVVPAS
ncbi:MAG: polysulfide reductase NrfD [Ktedonobacterales bacterium]